MLDLMEDIARSPLKSAAERFAQNLETTTTFHNNMFEMACIFGYHKCLGYDSYEALAISLGGPTISTDDDWHRRSVKIDKLRTKWGPEFYVEMGSIWPHNPSRSLLEDLVKWSGEWKLGEAKTLLERRIRDRLTSDIPRTRKNRVIMTSDLKNAPKKTRSLELVISHPELSPARSSRQSSPESPELAREAPLAGLKAEDYIKSSDPLFGDGENYVPAANSKRKRGRNSDGIFKPPKSRRTADRPVEEEVEGLSQLLSLPLTSLIFCRATLILAAFIFRGPKTTFRNIPASSQRLQLRFSQ